MYYMDKFSEIPNGIIAKGTTGIGLTSFALENSTPTIVVSPTVAMIQNKIAQYPNCRRSEKVLGVYSGISSITIEEYLKEVSNPKNNGNL